jgi:hypothetical protein
MHKQDKPALLWKFGQERRAINVLVLERSDGTPSGYAEPERRQLHCSSAWIFDTIINRVGNSAADPLARERDEESATTRLKRTDYNN